MKRECTEAENRVIKECAGDILARPENYRMETGDGLLLDILKLVKGSLIGAILSVTVFLGLSALAARNLALFDMDWTVLLIMIGVIAAAELLILMLQAYKKRKLRIKRLPGEKFWVNGGTVIQTKYSKAGAHLIFAEDDLTDSRKNPCSIIFPISYTIKVEPGERILLVYSDSGVYIPLRATDRTRDMIPAYAPAYFEDVDWSKAESFPHPAVMDLDWRSSALQEDEKAELIKKWNHFKTNFIQNGVAIALLSFLVLFLFGILFIFLVADDIIVEFSAAIVVFVLLVIGWILLTLLFAKLVLSGRARGLDKIQYRKKVMFYSGNGSYGEDDITVYENINGNVRLVSYPMMKGNVFLPKEISYGEMIYKYSQDAKSCEKDFHFFGPIE